MSIIGKVFEIKIKVGKVFKTYHYEKRTRRQAKEAAKKHGRVLSVRKVNQQSLLGDIEQLKLDREPVRSYLGGGIYEDELNIDEILGLRKKENRRSRHARDKEHKERDQESE